MEDYGTGRADFPGGSAKALYHSVSRNLYTLPDSTRVFVGHDYMPGGRAVRFESTIKRQHEANVQISDQVSEAEFIENRNRRDGTLRAPRLIYQSIQINVFGGRLPEAQENGVRFLATPLNLRQPTDSAGRPLSEKTEAAE